MCIYYIYIYIYIYIHNIVHRWHYSCNATCLIRPHLFYVFFVVPRNIIIMCRMIHHLKK